MELPDGQTFLQKAYLRSLSIPSIKSITTVTNKELLLKTKKEYENVMNLVSGAPFLQYITEPFGRNTAAAIALAALEIADLYGQDAVLLIQPSDHLISNQQAFLAAIEEAHTLARGGKIVTFGMKPSSPETGYGYIEAQGNDVVRFVEKPSLEQAIIYLGTNNYLWNSGIFCFSAETILHEMEKYCPDIIFSVKNCIAKSMLTENIQSRHRDIDPISFSEVPENSIDYAVMEKTAKAAVVPCEIGWSDVGTWSSMSDFSSLDLHGNNLTENIVTHNVRNCYIRSSGRVIGAVGLEDLIIVDTADALLVAHKKNSQDVKDIYSQLKKEGHDAHKLHRIAHRPWGTYTILEEGPYFKIKRLEVNPGASLSLQMHNKRAEHWVVVSGRALVVNGDDEFFLEFNQSTYIPAGNKHRLTNPGTEQLVMIEVQTGGYLEEDDIIRFDDIYGRIVAAV